MGGQANQLVVFDSSFKDYKPTSTKKWFCDCKILTSVKGIENLDTSNTTDMFMMFANCQSIESLDLSTFDTANVTNFASVFHNCYKLKNVNISGWDMSGATDVSCMFDTCRALTTVVVDGDFICCDSSKISEANQSRIFHDCQQLVGGHGLASASEYADDAGYASPDGIDGKSGYLTYQGAYAILKNNAVTFYNDGNHFAKDAEKIYSVGAKKNTGDWRKASNYTVDFDESFKSFEPLKINYWFRYTSITDLQNLKYLNTSRVTDLSSFLQGCSGLTTLDLRELNVSGVKDISLMFDDSSNLQRLMFLDGIPPACKN